MMKSLLILVLRQAIQMNTKLSKRLLVGGMLWLCLCCVPRAALAGIDLAAYAEIPLSQSLGIPLDQGTGIGHGILYFQYTDQTHVGAGNQLRAGLNTETVWLAWDIGATSRRPFVWSPYLRGQFGFGEMTPDYIAGGTFVENLSFYTMIAEAGVDWRWRLWRALHLSGNLALRYWWFLRRVEPATGSLTLPPNSPAIQSELALSWDAMEHWVARGRLAHGLQARVGVKLRHRLQQAPWGGLDTPRRDLRNASTSQWPTLQLTAHITGAVRVHERIALTLDAMAGAGWFADDLHRFKIGGDNPYVPMLSGTYFAEFVVDAYFLAHASAMFLPFWWLRITPQVDIGWIQDPLRLGLLQESRWIVGVGLTFDFFLRDTMRIHVKLSYAPNAPRPERDGGVKVMVGYIASWW